MPSASPAGGRRGEADQVGVVELVFGRRRRGARAPPTVRCGSTPPPGRGRRSRRSGRRACRASRRRPDAASRSRRCVRRRQKRPVGGDGGRVGGEGLDPHLALDAMRRADLGDDDPIPRRAVFRSANRGGHRRRSPSRPRASLPAAPRRQWRRRWRAPVPSCRGPPFRIVARRALGEAGGVEEAEHAIGRLGADLQPMLDPLLLQGDALLVGPWRGSGCRCRPPR